MTKENKHTGLRYPVVDAKGRLVAECFDLATAKEIIRAVNVDDKLINALKACKEISGRKMDYGSDSDAIQKIYITSSEALSSIDEQAKAEAGNV